MFISDSVYKELENMGKMHIEFFLMNLVLVISGYSCKGSEKDINVYFYTFI